MSPVRYSLHYEDYSEQLMSRFGKLLQQQALVDMTLMCSTHTLRVHKAVLAASSAYFEEVLQTVAGEPLVVLKISFTVLKSLVEFMYCGRTACEHDSLSELLAAARFLGIKGLSRVTREGLGITHHEEIPEFSMPVVINRPPLQSDSTLAPPQILAHTQECGEPQPSTSQAADVMSNHSIKMDAETCLPMHCVTRRQDAAPRVTPEAAADAAAARGRYGRARRGRANMRSTHRGGGGMGWERRGVMARAAERALLRRERDTQHAIHRLRALQESRMQEYMERVSLTRAVDSIRGPGGYELAAAGSVEAAGEALAEAAGVGEGVGLEEGEPALSSAVSQYVDALKSAGLPTDLPIVFETGDGSYVNVDEQVLLDMVQSSEIQYEVVEHPISLEVAAEPGQVNSIDDLSRCIEQGSMRSYPQEEACGLSAILPDSAEPYSLPEPPARARLEEPPDADPFGAGGLADVSAYYERHYGMSEAAELQRAHDALDCLADADDDRFGGMLKFHERPEPGPDVEMEGQPEQQPEPAAQPDEEAPPEPEACAEELGVSAEVEDPGAGDRGGEGPGEESDAAADIEKLIDKIKSEKLTEAGEPGRGVAPGVGEESDATTDIERLVDKIKSDKLMEAGEPGRGVVEGAGEARGRRHKRRASRPHPQPSAALNSMCLRSKVKKKM